MSKKITQQEAEERVLNKCKEKNYTLLEPFIYKNQYSKFNLKCNLCNHKWSPIYNNFINHKRGCPKCGNVIMNSNIKTYNNVIERCKEMNYELFEPFYYLGNKKNNIKFKMS